MSSSYKPPRCTSLDHVDLSRFRRALWGFCFKKNKKKELHPYIQQRWVLLILPMETHNFILSDSSLCGLLACNSFSTQTRHLASCISSWRVGGEHPGPSTCAVSSHKTCHDPHPHTHTHTPSTAMARRWPEGHSLAHNGHSSHWRETYGIPHEVVTPHRKHPAVTAAHTELTGLFRESEQLEIDISPLSSDLKLLRRIERQNGEASANTHAITLPLASSPLLPPPSTSTHVLCPTLALILLFALFFYHFFVHRFFCLFPLVYPVYVSTCLFISVSHSLFLCVSVVLGVLADPGLPVKVGGVV